jgi:hypothetical protein
MFALLKTAADWSAHKAAATVLLALSALWWLGWTPYRDIALARQLMKCDDERIANQALVRDVDSRFTHGQPVVVGYHPYFFTQATHAPALAIPASDDAFLLGYMRKYHAHFVLLTRAERDFWRPAWRHPEGLPPQLRMAADLGNAYLYELQD